MDNYPHSSKETRMRESVDFVINELVLRREEILDALKVRFTHSEVETEGCIGVITSTPGESLFTDFVHSAEPDAASNYNTTEVDIKTKVIRTYTEQGDFVHTAQIIVSPPDSLPIILRDDQGLYTMARGDSISLIDQQTYCEALTSLAKTEDGKNVAPDVTDEQILNGILIVSPRSERLYRFQKEDEDSRTTIVFNDIETDTDSVHAIDIEIVRPHPSGKMVRTRILVRESLLEKHANGDKNTDHTAAVMVRDPRVNMNDITIESFDIEGLESRQINLETMTKYHMADILDALYDLMDPFAA